MKKILSVLTFVMLFIVQTSMGEELKIFNVTPNFILVLVLIFSINSELIKSATLGCICGFFLDAAGIGISGYNALIMMYISVLASAVSSRFYYESKFVPAFGVFIFTLIFEITKVLISNALFDSLPVFYVMWRYIFIECILNFIVAIPLLYWINWLKNEYIRGI